MTTSDAGPPRICPACRHAAPRESRFCPACGAAASGVPPAARGGLPQYLPWIFGAAASLTLVALLLRPAPAPAPAPGEAQEEATAPPDLSTMSPVERFDRLYQRVITAAQSGDQATVTRFTPMALAAFRMMDTVTVDNRYHLAMLQLHVGDLAGAQAQADTVARQNPSHLFGYVIGAAVARWNKNDGARDSAWRKFLERYDREIATRRPEYLEHQAMLEEVKKAATAGKSKG